MDELGRKLKELREQRGWTQREAARKLGISNTRLSEFEIGITRTTGRPAIPARETLTKAAEVFGYPLDVLLTLARLPVVEPTPAPMPSQDEAESRELMETFRLLDAGRKRLLLGISRVFRSEALEQPEKS